jgi:DNA invertase Pin-like site-specific DNA recombinase
MNMAATIIGYQRVSTKGQGESGLGLEAQEVTIRAFAREKGAAVIAVYTEVESGKVADRPELTKALAHARRSKATLCVAKLDRLSRNVKFLATVMDSGCEFAAADMPAANRFMLHVMAAVAEHEAKAISDRTKGALAAAKARGTLLGGSRPECRMLTQEARLLGAKHAGQARTQAAKEAYTDLLPSITAMKAEGLSLRGIAGKLNAEGHTTRRGRPWNAVQVSRVLERAEAK